MGAPKKQRRQSTDGAASERISVLTARLDRALALLEQELSHDASAQQGAGGRRRRIDHGAVPPVMSLVRRVVTKLRGVGTAAQGAMSPWEAVRQAIDDLGREHKKQTRQAQQEQANADEWERRAKLCVKASDDQLASDALANRKWHLELKADRDRDARALENALETYRRFESEFEQVLSPKR